MKLTGSMTCVKVVYRNVQGEFFKASFHFLNASI